MFCYSNGFAQVSLGLRKSSPLHGVTVLHMIYETLRVLVSWPHLFQSEMFKVSMFNYIETIISDIATRG